MAEKVVEEDKKLPNLEILQDIRLRGKPLRKGAVVAKADFPNKGLWMTLENMPKPRVKQTSDKVRSGPAPAKAGKDDAAMPGT